MKNSHVSWLKNRHVSEPTRCVKNIVLVMVQNTAQMISAKTGTDLAGTQDVMPKSDNNK